MSNVRLAHSAVLTALFAAGTFAVAQTSTPPNQDTRPRTPTTTQQTTPKNEQARLDLRRVSKLHGIAVMSSDNEKVGDIQSLAVDLQSGKAYYAILSSGGVLGVGSDWTPVPYKAVNFGTPESDEYRLNVTKAQFEAAAKINDEQWNRLADPNWAQATYKHFNVQFKPDEYKSDSGAAPTNPNTPPTRPQDRTTPPAGTSPGTTTPPSGTGSGANDPQYNPRHTNPNQMNSKQTLNLVRSDKAIGMDVHNPQDEDLGEINDLVIDARSGQIAYAVLGAGGMLGMNEKLHALPWQALRLDRENDQFVVSVTKDRLEDAPGFDKDNWPKFADATWSRSVHQFYGTDPDWIYGFSDNDDDDVDIDVDVKTRDRNLQGWEADSEYNRMFKSGETQTLNCTVTRVERTRFMPSMSEGVALHVTCENQPQVIHLGPVSFIESQNIEFNNGDQVTIKGVRATVNGKQVIMASEVQANNKTIKLRDASGKPMWSNSSSSR